MSRSTAVVLLSLLCALAAANKGPASADSHPERFIPSYPQEELDESCFQDIQYDFDKMYYHPVTTDSAGNTYFQGYGTHENQNNSVIFGNLNAKKNLYNFVMYFYKTETGRSRVYNFVRQPDSTLRASAPTYLITEDRKDYYYGPLVTTVRGCSSHKEEQPASETTSKKRAPSPSPLVSSDLCFQDSIYGDKFYYHQVTKDSEGNAYYRGYGVYNNQNSSTIFGNYDVKSSLYNFVLYFYEESIENLTGRSRVYNFLAGPDGSFTDALTYGVNANQDGYYSSPRIAAVRPC